MNRTDKITPWAAAAVAALLGAGCARHSAVDPNNAALAHLPGPAGSGPWVTSTSLKAKSGVMVKVALRSACVRPGATQALTVHGPPRRRFIYQAVYADGKNGWSAGYYGGNDFGTTDAKGAYTGSWAIAPAAPPGPVHVDLVELGGPLGRIRVGFKMADAQGGCR